MTKPEKQSPPGKAAAFIGLGVMGFPMAGHLKEKGGYDVRIYNRSPAKAEKWVARHGGFVAKSPAEAAEGCDFVFACVGRDEDVLEITTGSEGVFQTMASGSVFTDHTTASAKLARHLSEEGAKKHIQTLDAPVSGGQSGAEEGILSIMCGGASKTFEAAIPLMRSYGKNIVHIGPAGAGQLAKMVNQICVAGAVQGLAEGLDFGRRAGLDMEKTVKAISAGAASSWQMLNRSETMLAEKFDYGFAIDWMQKDLKICFEEAQNNQATLPVTALISQFYTKLQRQNKGRWDTSSLIDLLKQN